MVETWWPPETAEPPVDVRRPHFSTAGVNAALGHEGIADILTEIMRKLKELRSQFESTSDDSSDRGQAR
jgi:hypothetical protein